MHIKRLDIGIPVIHRNIMVAMNCYKSRNFTELNLAQVYSVHSTPCTSYACSYAKVNASKANASSTCTHTHPLSLSLYLTHTHTYTHIHAHGFAAFQ